ncbi:hypothetical protein [Streptomyces rubiginosohelvolus]|uniref:hypothetical protein n=1 Tax=Streptomyces rubiginosohelvolus TaxID=67362 RepID=UPI0035E00437
MAEHDTNAPPLFELGDVSPVPPTAPAFMDLQHPDYAYMFGFLQADGHLAQGTGHKGRLTVEISRRDYLRGVIDADGSVGHTGQGLPFVSLTTASAAVGAYLCRYAKAVTGSARQIGRNARDGIYNVVYTKEAAVRLAGHLYYPGCLSLARKQTAATALASWERPADMPVRSPGRRWKPWEDRALLAHGDGESAAAELGRSAASCSVRLWRLKTGKVRRPEGGPAGA